MNTQGVAPAETSAHTESFDRFGLNEQLLTAIAEVGYETPTPIQLKTIPLLIAERDIIGQAQTGTGKTAAFALPILQRLDVKKKAVQAIVLTPTRELAIQVAEAFHIYAKHSGGVRVLPIYGGQSIQQQISRLDAGAQIVVGTPGRVMDHLRRGTLDLAGLKFVVLDEADEMLRMGFIDDVEWILGHTPPTRQTALFSATMPREVRRIADRYLKDPANVEIEHTTQTIPTIDQFYINVSEYQKLDALTRLLEADADSDGAVLIFDRTKMGADALTEKLQARGYAAEAMHGDMSQAQREAVIRRLRNGQVEIVVATDVAARGLDVDRITRVINYDMPNDPEVYVHRIGRTGRAGRAGKSMLFVTARQQRMKYEIERYTNQPLVPVRMPTKADVAARRVAAFKERVLKTIESGELDLYLTLVEQLAEESGRDIAEIAAAVARLAGGDKPLETLSQPEPESERERFTQPGNDRPARGDDAGRDERSDERPAPREDKRPPRRPEMRAEEVRDEQGMTRLFVDVGNHSGVTPPDIVGAIANEADIPGKSIGAIEINERNSFVDVPSALAAQIVERMRGSRIRSHNANIRLANERDIPGYEPPRARVAAKKPAIGKSADKKPADKRVTGKSIKVKSLTSNSSKQSSETDAAPRRSARTSTKSKS